MLCRNHLNYLVEYNTYMGDSLSHLDLLLFRIIRFCGRHPFKMKEKNQLKDVLQNNISTNGLNNGLNIPYMYMGNSCLTCHW